MLRTQDVALLDNAFSGLSDTLMRNRMMKQEQQRQTQEQQRLQQNATAMADYRAGELQAKNKQLSDEELYRQMMESNAGDKLAEETRHNKAMEGNQTAKETDLTKRLKQNTIQFHDKQIDEIIDHVNKGVITPEQGTQMIKQGVSKWDDWEKQENPLFGQYSSPDFALTAKPPKPAVPGTGDPNKNRVIADTLLSQNKDESGRITNSVPNIISEYDQYARPPVSAVAQTPSRVAPPQAAVNHLKQNPSTATAFNQKYGAGSAESILGQ